MLGPIDDDRPMHSGLRGAEKSVASRAAFRREAEFEWDHLGVQQTDLASRVMQWTKLQSGGGQGTPKRPPVPEMSHVTWAGAAVSEAKMHGESSDGRSQ